MDYPIYPIDDRLILTEEIPADKILIWKTDLDRKKLGYYAEGSMSHPAKMHVKMCRFILRKCTKPFDRILDPMAGISTTILEASLLGRDAIGVEYEDKFVKLSDESIKLLKSKASLAYKGGVVVVQGDVRDLTNILADEADSIVCSPPYCGTQPFHDQGFTLQSTKTNPTPRKISDQNYGVDAIWMSPPFSCANSGGGIAKKGYKGKHGVDNTLHKRHERKLTVDGSNISNLPHGKIDAIISSPPYVNSVASRTDPDKRNSRLNEAGYGSTRWGPAGCLKSPGRSAMFSENTDSDDKNNIGNLPKGKIDVIVTSPPYEDTMGKRHHSPKGDKFVKEKEHYNVYSKDCENLGNLNKKTYLGEMRKVYSQCHAVLKEGGCAVLVTKNFTRNWKMVRLDMDTIMLMESCGFKLVDRYFRKLIKKSFWIRNYELRFLKKFPGRTLPTAQFEDILVFRKCSE
jgi:DNA modification methylase